MIFMFMILLSRARDVGFYSFFLKFTDILIEKRKVPKNKRKRSQYNKGLNEGFRPSKQKRQIV